MAGPSGPAIAFCRRMLELPFRRLTLVATLAGFLTACGSQYTIADRSKLKPSSGSRIASHNLLPMAGQAPPDVSEHLAQALEMYQTQLALLKERRNKVRARKRTLSTAAFAIGAAGLAGSMGEVIMLDGERESTAVGLTALVAFVAATAFKIGETVQEDSSAVDSKIVLLDEYYANMLSELRRIQDSIVPSGDPAKDESIRREASVEMSTIIENFIQDAQAINVKG
jgi:hypothetical protein